MEKDPDLQVTVAGIRMKNPVMTASGTFGYGREYADMVDLSRLGAIVVKGLHLNPAKGNPPPRIVETPCGMLNAIGLENVGIQAFVNEKLPYLMNLNIPVIVNIYGHIVEEYVEVAAVVDGEPGITGIEVNISCPNIKEGGVAFGVNPKSAHGVIAAVRKATKKPIIAKLSPNVTDITEIAKSAEAAGADAVSLINTITGMAVDIESRRPKLANATGGLSGPAIKPIALRMVWQTVKSVAIPVVGIGGIMTAQDALEFLVVGASAVQVGTANFVNPRATLDILEGIEAFMVKKGIQRISEIIGSFQV
ncbi:MAG: dihydroorotate dehydrogenase [Desulfobacterales bacterium CG07_land_8_20_14_0_80_52_14]|nr:MAG: dihydroorotate dehydrogenase B catalytic subunit [Desulfobacterales bacterium CG23_combo_of_CG06-09_8_20_14_all_52_9]PIU50697.1 MAG: dihydroorotate dehydrogenase [Desulfobacterales bacterium CG07_land_8_20_14_0_80_52_14]